MHPQSVVDEIKERLSIAAVIGEQVPLKRAGRNFKGLCPFHKEKTPSFMVSDEKQIYHCFGCGDGGDVFRFVMKLDGLSFPEAIESLAARAGVALPENKRGRAGGTREDAGKSQHRRLLLRVNELAAQYYNDALMDPARGAPARNYLKSRGFINNEFLTQHFLGCAEEQWDGLARFLQSRKVPMELAVELGLVKRRKEGGCFYDFFRHRLLFPIRGLKGEMCGFSGRALPGGDPGGHEDVAKYMNSADSVVYQKNRTVYGLYAALPAVRENDRVLIVEGNVDVLSCHQAGLTEVVAPLGTALTENHVRLLRRFTRNMWVIFDGDAAGRQAARRSLPLFLAEGLVPRVVVLPDGDDPDTFVRREGADAVRAMLPGAATLFEWVIDDLVATSGGDITGKSRAVQNLRPLFAQLNDPIQEAGYIGRLSSLLAIDEHSVRSALKKNFGMKNPQSAIRNPQLPVCNPQAAIGVHSAEAALLEFILQVPAAMALVAGKIQPDEFNDTPMREIARLCWRFYEERGELRVANVVCSDTDPDLCARISAMALGDGKYEDEEVWPRMADDLVAFVRKPQLHVRLRELDSAIADAERAGKVDQVTHLMAQKKLLQSERSLWNENR